MIRDSHIDRHNQIASFVKLAIESEYDSIREFCRINEFNNSMIAGYLNQGRRIRFDTFLSILDALNGKLEISIGEITLNIES